jgi:RES domain-containing protein
MLLWRISPFRNLNGEGGLRFSARWHTAGIPVVYLAESPAGALLEICANTAADDIPSQFTLLKVVGPDVAVEKVALSDLPSGWITGFDVTRRIGMGWLESRRSALLQVPSALVPETANFLFNPLHPDAAQFQIERAYEYPFDLRLKS